MEKKVQKENQKEQEKASGGKEQKVSQKKKLSLKSKTAVFAGLLFLVLALAVVSLYFYPPLEKFSRPIFKRFPFPVAVIDGGKFVISSSSLIQNADAVKKFYQSQDYAKSNLRVDFSTEDGKNRLKIKEKDVFNKLIENKLIEKLAQEQGIQISQQQVQEEIDRKIAEGGDRKSLELNLMSLYGWTIADFRDQVVIYQMYTKLLLDWHAGNVASAESYQKISEAKNKLNQDGSNFSDIAKEYSEGDSAQNGGEVGWFTKEELVAEVAEVVFEMKEGAVSEIIASPLGFHIVQVSGFEGEGTEQSPKKANLSQIFVRGESFLDWLAQQKKELDVIILMKDYAWDKEQGVVVFRKEEFNKMEKLLRLKAQGDPSL